MQVYLDNAATTRVDPEAVELMSKIFTEDYGNPSSLHKIGYKAEQYVNEALNVFSGQLKWKRKNVIFTSGGTESNNTAIFGTALFKEARGKHIITSAVEHSSVSEPFNVLEKRGWEVDRISVDSEGVINLDELREKLRPDTVLLSLMHVNNETGAIQPVEEAGALVKEKSPECFFHVDDIQGFGKIKTDTRKAGIDLLSVSAHKIHGPKGVGLLYVSDKAGHIPPLVYGGGQQNGMRSGTINVPGIAGFGKAASLMYEDLEGNFDRMKELRDYFTSELRKLPDIKINAGERVSPYIVSLTVKGVRAEVLLHALEERGVYVSAGSACSSHKKHISPTLVAMGLTESEAEETIRFSFNRHTTKEELTYAADSLFEVIPELRRFKRR
ncbi:MAG: cysteine desulfurase [Lachnospiraceae bacterium]|nr:cysteine desulfurase [Lachnospiraceae bacterium]